MLQQCNKVLYAACNYLTWILIAALLDNSVMTEGHQCSTEMMASLMWNVVNKQSISYVHKINKNVQKLPVLKANSHLLFTVTLR